MYQDYIKKKTISQLQSFIEDIEKGKIEVVRGMGFRPDSVMGKGVYEIYLYFIPVEQIYTIGEPEE